MTWLTLNKEWIFSGIGIVALSMIVTIIKYCWGMSQEKLKVNIERAVIKFITRECYQIKINLSISATSDTHTLKRLILKGKSNAVFNEGHGTPYSCNGMLLNEIFSLQEPDILENHASFNPFTTEEMNNHLSPIIDKTLHKGQTTSLSIIRRIQPIRMPDGWEDMDLDGWSIIVEFDHGNKITIPFSFLIHRSSLTQCSQWSYVGFSEHIPVNSGRDFRAS